MGGRGPDTAFPPLAAVLVVAGQDHGGPEHEVAVVVELGEGLVVAAVLLALPGQLAAVEAGALGVTPVEGGDGVGANALAAIDPDDAAVAPVRLGVVRATAAAILPGHRPTPEAGEMRGALHNRRGFSGHTSNES